MFLAALQQQTQCLTSDCFVRCLQAAFGVQPGTHVTVKNTSEVLHLTLAYSAVSSVVAAIAEWRDLRGAQV